MATKPLTDLFLKKLTNPDRKKYSDGGGLHLFISPAGSKLWHMTYYFGGKERVLSFGPYPLISLKEAREKRDAAKKLLLEGIDPGQKKREQKERDANTFEKVFNEWFTKFHSTKDPDTQKRMKSYFTKYVFPYIGSRPIKELAPKDIWKCVERMEQKGIVESAHRTLSYCGHVFRYATANGFAERDITVDLKGLLPPSIKKHYATIIEPREIGKLLRAIDEYQGHYPVTCALKLAPLLFVRPGELRRAEWEEFDFERAEWHIPPEKMKIKVKHIVPLSTQALTILKELYIFNGRGQYLFPSLMTNKRPVSDNTFNTALRRMGYTKEEMTAHGFRAMASTLLNEQGYNRDWIERQLAHCERNKVRAAYNYAEFMQERRTMMQEWADYLDKLKSIHYSS